MGATSPELLPVFVAGLLPGLVLAGILPPAAAWPCLAVALLVLALPLGMPQLRPGHGLAHWLLLALAASLLGVFLGLTRSHTPLRHQDWDNVDRQSGTLSATVVGEYRLSRAGKFQVTVEDAVFSFASQSVAIPGQVALAADDAEFCPEPHQRIIASGTLEAPGKHRTAFFQSNATPAPEPTDVAGLGGLRGKLRRAIWSAMGSFLSGEHHAVMLGLLLGDTSRLSPGTRHAFKVTGTSHLMAVSGGNIAALALVWVALLAWIGIPPLSRSLLAIGGMALYGLITIGEPSVWRAIVMYACTVVAHNIEAEPGPVRPLAAAALLLLIYEPTWIHHLGFQLSFVAVLGIVLLTPRFDALMHFLPLWLARYLSVSFAANLATAPLIAYHFGAVSVISWVANPLVVWMFGLILPMGLVLALIGPLWFQGGVLLAGGLSLLLDLFLRVLGILAQVPLAQVAVPRPPGWLVAMAYLLMLAWAATGPATGRHHDGVNAGNHRRRRAPDGPDALPPTVTQTTWVRSGTPSILDDGQLLAAIDQHLSVLKKRSQQHGDIVRLSGQQVDHRSANALPSSRQPRAHTSPRGTRAAS